MQREGERGRQPGKEGRGWKGRERKERKEREGKKKVRSCMLMTRMQRVFFGHSFSVQKKRRGDEENKQTCNHIKRSMAYSEGRGGYAISHGIAFRFEIRFWRQ